MVHSVFIDDADIVGTACFQCSGRRIGIIAHFLRLAQDIHRMLVFRICQAVQRTRNSGDRNATDLSDILYCDQPALPPICFEKIYKMGAVNVYNLIINSVFQ